MKSIKTWRDFWLQMESLRYKGRRNCKNLTVPIHGTTFCFWFHDMRNEFPLQLSGPTPNGKQYSCILHHERPLHINIRFRIHLHQKKQDHAVWKMDDIVFGTLYELMGIPFQKAIKGRGPFKEVIQTIKDLDHILVKAMVHPRRDRILRAWNEVTELVTAVTPEALRTSAFQIRINSLMKM